MIILSMCNSCMSRFEILVEPKQVHLIKAVSDKKGTVAKCPRLCGGMINLVGSPGLDSVWKSAKGKAFKAPLKITALELYQAIGGLGLPDEVANDPDVMKSMLLSSRIVGVDLEKESSNDTYYLHEIRLENGVTFHLGSGLRGASVIKMTKEMHRAVQRPGRSRSSRRA